VLENALEKSCQSLLSFRETDVSLLLYFSTPSLLLYSIMRVQSHASLQSSLSLMQVFFLLLISSSFFFFLDLSFLVNPVPHHHRLFSSDGGEGSECHVKSSLVHHYPAFKGQSLPCFLVPVVRTSHFEHNFSRETWLVLLTQSNDDCSAGITSPSK